MHPMSVRPSRRQVTMARRFFRLLPVTLVSAPLVAQVPRDSVVSARAVSSTWQDVDRMKQELITQRSLELALFKKLAEVEMQRQAALPDSQRALLQAQAQLLFSQMHEVSLEQRKLMGRIETLCARVRQPKGWIGVNTTGVQLKEQRADGATYIRFLEPPVVASVDPGSPADRVGVQAGDVLVEIGGQRLLQTSVSFADLLRPGEAIAIKLTRGGETVVLMPKVEPLPDVSTTPCAWVDPGLAYYVRPMPSQAPTVVRVESSPGRYSYGFATARRDTSGTRVQGGGGAGGVMAGPMVSQFTGGANSLAGVQLMALSPESSRRFGVEHGILVNQVAPGTPGRNAGLLGGDIVVSADSVDVRSIQQLQRVIYNATDRVVTLVIVRDKKRETVQLRW
jgi:C-terminal processing protease CtpA/Prc